MSFDGYEDEHLLVNEQHAQNDLLVNEDDQNDDGDDPVRGVVATQARSNESSILPTHQFWQLGLRPSTCQVVLICLPLFYSCS